MNNPPFLSFLYLMPFCFPSFFPLLFLLPTVPVHWVVAMCCNVFLAVLLAGLWVEDQDTATCSLDSGCLPPVPAYQRFHKVSPCHRHHYTMRLAHHAGGTPCA